MGRPLVAPTLALIAGIFCSSRFQFADEVLLLILLIIFLLFLFPPIQRAWKATFCLVIAAAFTVGWLEMNAYLYRLPDDRHIVNFRCEDPVSITGIIGEPPHFYPEKTELLLDVVHLADKEGRAWPTTGKMLLSFRGTQKFAYGDVVSARTRLRHVRNFHNPGGFDYERYLRFQGILVRGAVADDSRIILLRRGFGNPLRQRLEQMRGHIRSFIDARAPSPEREIIKACILGDQQEIPREIRDAFSKTGTAHIIAISGFNMGLVAVFSMLLARWAIRRFPGLLLRWDLYKLSVLAAMPPVILYTFIAGAGMSVLRATLMIIAFMISLALSRDRDLFNSLAMAALIILVFYPPALFDISFQLSFAAVAAILFISPRLTALLSKPPVDKEKTSRIAFWAGKLKYDGMIFLIASLSATLGAMPLIACYFNRISIVSLPANILLVPVLGILAVPVSLTTIFLMPISPLLSGFCLDLAGTLVMVSLALNDYFAALPWAAIYVITPNTLEIICFYIFVFLLFLVVPHGPAATFPAGPARAKPPNWLFHAIAAILIFFLIDAAYLDHAGQNRQVMQATAIDVGQGSSTLVRLPGDKVMLIDGGGFPRSAFDVGRYIVAPFLWHERIRKIDIVVLTHPHPDHVNGLPFIMENFSVSEFWSNGETAASSEYEELNRIVKSRNINHLLVSSQSPPLLLDGVKIEFLNPPHTGGGNSGATNYQEANDRSVALRMTYGGISFLHGGDISAASEQRIAAAGGNMHSALLFVPHHGGRTSATDTFLRAVRPEAAVVSVGCDNYFRLPATETIRRFRERNVQVYRTDRQGAITAVTDGLTLRIDPFLVP